MKLTGLGHTKGEEPGNGVNSSGFWKQGAARLAGDGYMPLGCLMGHSSLGVGKPATWRRTPREYIALKGNSCRTLLGWVNTREQTGEE